MAIAALVAGAGFLGAKMAQSVKSQQAAAGSPAAPMTDPSTTVDPKRAAAVNAGRAGLIQTSPQGVLGTDPTGRRRLLGN